jgi:GNAT superfamily N-acetyltransferase
MPRGHNWFCLIRHADGTPHQFVCVESDRYPDGTRVELSADAAAVQIGDRTLCTVTYGRGDQVTGLEIPARVAPGAPPLWFVELRQPAAQPPTVELLAFTGHGQPAGTLLDEAAASNLAITNDDQLAAVRWWPATGEVDQFYVQPDWRRRGIGTAILAAGGVLSAARDWPRFWGDGQRTALGEKFRDGGRWPHRMADLTNLAPPMTPGDPG